MPLYDKNDPEENMHLEFLYFVEIQNKKDIKSCNWKKKTLFQNT